MSVGEMSTEKIICREQQVEDNLRSLIPKQVLNSSEKYKKGR